MHLNGYDSAKMTFRVEMTPDEIVRHAIDPWRVDLCDPDPVELVIDGRPLRFRKLQDVSFAYWLDGGKTVLGMQSADGQVCVTGDTEHLYFDQVKLRGIRTCEGTFEQHFRQYLTGLQASNVAYLQNTETMRNPTRGRPSYTWVAKPANAVTLNGTSVSYDALNSEHLMVGRWRKTFNPPLSELTFVGEMLKERQVPTVLPAAVNWVFETFGEFNPIVVGDSLRKALRNERRTVVEVLVDENTRHQVHHIAVRLRLGERVFAYKGQQIHHKRFDNLPASLFIRMMNDFQPYVMFTNDGCTYIITERKQTQSLADVFRADGHAFSSQCLYARAPAIVSGSRIDLFDAGANLARQVYRRRHDEMAGGNGKTITRARAHELSIAGIRVLPSPD